jgi:tRNA dimethylallyltransferase
MHKIKYDLITILGPTACGKTRFAATLSSLINGEIISADSRQVYRRMNMGTGKDYDDYIVDGKKIPYHLVDILEPGEKYNVYEFQKHFIEAYMEIRARGSMPVLCGGSGMYIDAVTRGYRLLPVPRNNELRKRLQSRSLGELSEILSAYKKLHNITDTDTKQRAIRAIEIEDYYKSNPLPENKYPEIDNIFIGIKADMNTRRERISRRLHERLDRGMVTEVENLLGEGLAPADLVYYGLEYKYITLHITGELDYDSMVEKLNTAIRQFAKRQMTWFRKMEREGARIHWLDSSMPMQQKIRRTMSLLDI